MTKRTLIILLVGILLFCVAVFVTVLTDKGPAPQAAIQLPDNIGGSFTLTNQDGVKESSAAFKNRYKLLYFGFTHCPAICPTELQKIARAVDGLGDQAKHIKPLFVTVDPERDTVKVMKDYVGLFNMDLSGYTGTPEEIAAVMKQYRIFAAKTQEEGMSDYTVDHSSFIYLLSPDDKIVDLYKMEDGPEVMIERIKTFLPAP